MEGIEREEKPKLPENQMKDLLAAVEKVPADRPVVIMGMGKKARALMLSEIGALRGIGKIMAALYFVDNEAELEDVMKKLPRVDINKMMDDAVEKINILHLSAKEPEIDIEERELPPWHRKAKLPWEKKGKKKGYRK